MVNASRPRKCKCCAPCPTAAHEPLPGPPSLPANPAWPARAAPIPPLPPSPAPPPESQAFASPRTPAHTAAPAHTHLQARARASREFLAPVHTACHGSHGLHADWVHRGWTGLAGRRLLKRPCSAFLPPFFSRVAISICFSFSISKFISLRCVVLEILALICIQDNTRGQAKRRRGFRLTGSQPAGACASRPAAPQRGCAPRFHPHLWLVLDVLGTVGIVEGRQRLLLALHCGRDGCDDARLGLAAERVAQQAGELGVAVWHVPLALHLRNGGGDRAWVVGQGMRKPWRERIRYTEFQRP